MNLFRDLNEEEVKEFRQWARNNPENLNIFEQKECTWHPVVIAEYRVMKLEVKNGKM